MKRLIRIFGATSAFALLLLSSGCRFPYSMTGGGLPRHLRTAAIIPFENRTTSSGLERELSDLLSTDLRQLGLREAPEGRADVLVTGSITKYETDIPVAFSANPASASGTRRKLQLVVDVKITEQASGRALFEKRGILGNGEYDSAAEMTGRKEAIEKVVREVIQGVQSQW